MSVMGLVIVLLLLALVFGGVGLFITGLQWALAVALILVLVSAFSGWTRGTARTSRRHREICGSTVCPVMPGSRAGSSRAR
jgi:membrane protein implicated in regulation of membrane protease activity